MFAFLFAFILAVLLTPLSGRAAVKLGIVDKPDSLLKTHRKPTPYLGGAAVFCAVCVSVALISVREDAAPDAAAMLAGAVLVLAGGLLDDWRPIKPWQKLILQSAAAVCVCSLGLRASLFEQPVLDTAAASLWIVGLTNAFNLIDIMDGLAAGVAGAASLFIGFLHIAVLASSQATIPLALSGACCGFLLYNFKPASIFLGDAGSQILGFVLACSSLQWIASVPHSYRYWIPPIVLGIPLFEMLFISVLRLRAGRSPLAGSPDHYALRMVKLGLTVQATVLISYLSAVVLGLAALLLFHYPAEAIYLIIILLVSLLFVSIRLSRVDMGTALRRE